MIGGIAAPVPIPGECGRVALAFLVVGAVVVVAVTVVVGVPVVAGAAAVVVATGAAVSALPPQADAANRTVMNTPTRLMEPSLFP